MSEPNATDQTILKVLSGVQSGAEVALRPGEYAIGSGLDDDIQFIDVSLKAGHAKLRVQPGKIEIAAGSGAVSTQNGLRIAAGADDWQEVEPLDIITAGTMRFALGPPTANWTTLTDADTSADAPPPPRPQGAKRTAAGRFMPVDLRRVIFPAVLLLAVAVLGGWYYAFASGGRANSIVGETRNDVETIRTALDQFPFGRPIRVKQEVDGTIFATGFVETAVERRALLGAVEKSGVPNRFRVGVLDSMRNEIDSFIKDQNVSVTAALSPAGDLTLDGIILSEDNAKRFVDRLQGLVIGLRRVDSRIRTAKTVLGEIEKLTRLSQIDSYVLLRLDGELVEANGVLPIEKIDSWVGFLQSYSRRFAKDIGLRSFVQLQNANGTLVPAPTGTGGIVIGGKGRPNDVVLDMDRLARGDYKQSDIFVTGSNGTRPAAEPAVARGSIPPFTFAADKPATSEGPAAERPLFDPGNLTRRANSLLRDWRAGNSGADDIAKALETIAAARAKLDQKNAAGNPADDAKKYLPLLPAVGAVPAGSDACRTGSRLTAKNLPAALFWLDLLSVSTTMSLSDFDREEQAFILEAALNPRLDATCLKRAGGNEDAANTSLYLSEAARNPDFVRYVTRNLPAFALDITGASLTTSRYVQIRNGVKMREGQAPDSASRLSQVGELGVAIQLKDGYAAVIYAPEINWFSQQTL
jgi:type III secretion system YscD/HrpQ family protein